MSLTNSSKLEPKWIALGAGSAVAIFVIMFIFAKFPGTVGLIIEAGLALGTGAFIAFLPKLQSGKRGSMIDDALPFFITHFGVLATSNLPRSELLRILAENREYTEIAREMRRVLRLTQEWGLGLADAVRAVAESTPSRVFSAFLLRLAHSLESGQSLEGFLMAEQGVVMHDYTSIYTAQLLKVESWKEMYTNAIMTIGFLSVFASVLPLLVGGSTVLLTAGIVGFTLVLEILLGVALKDRLPRDRLSPTRVVVTEFQNRIRIYIIASVGIGAALAVVAFFLWGWGAVMLCLTAPLIVPGVYAASEERSIRQRETEFPAFIRSLGAAAAARGGAVRNVLGSIQANNLGALTNPVRDLHRRLSWKVDDRRAWQVFGEQTQSRLIDSFTAMFVEGIGAGGKPGPISTIISDNMLKILALRTTRRATGGTFRSLLIGLGLGLAIVLFMGSAIFATLTSGFAQFSDILAQQGLFYLEPASSAKLAQTFLFVLMAIHGIAAGFFFKLVEGGRLEGAALDAAIYSATGIVTGMAVLAATPHLLHFGG